MVGSKPDGANVKFHAGQITWNGEAIDEAELAKRAALHWSQKVPYVLMFDADLPAPDDHEAIAMIKRVSRITRTKPNTLEKTLRKLADGTF